MAGVVGELTRLFVLYEAGAVDAAQFAAAKAEVLRTGADAAPLAVEARRAPRKGAGALQVFVRDEGSGVTHPVEVRADGCVGDVRAAVAAEPGRALMFAGDELSDAAVLLSDAGVTAQATLVLSAGQGYVVRSFEHAAGPELVLEDGAAALYHDGPSQIDLLAVCPRIDSGKVEWELLMDHSRSDEPDDAAFGMCVGMLYGGEAPTLRQGLVGITPTRALAYSRDSTLYGDFAGGRCPPAGSKTIVYKHNDKIGFRLDVDKRNLQIFHNGKKLVDHQLGKYCEPPFWPAVDLYRPGQGVVLLPTTSFAAEP